jgi:hypothetical protein
MGRAAAPLGVEEKEGLGCKVFEKRAEKAGGG